MNRPNIVSTYDAYRQGVPYITNPYPLPPQLNNSYQPQQWNIPNNTPTIAPTPTPANTSFVDTLNQWGNTAGDYMSQAGNTVGGWLDQAGNTLSDWGTSIGNSISNGYDAVKNFFSGSDADPIPRANPALQQTANQPNRLNLVSNFDQINNAGNPATTAGNSSLDTGSSFLDDFDWKGWGGLAFQGFNALTNYRNQRDALKMQKDFMNKQWNLARTNYNNNLAMTKQRNIDMTRAKSKFETGNANTYDGVAQSVNDKLKEV